MHKTIGFAVAALAIAAAVPAVAKTDCAAGYKTFMGKMSTTVDIVSGDALAEAVRKSLVAYDSCKAGDDFSPHGVWDKIYADMAASAGKK
jgi:hypothetical protein